MKKQIKTFDFQDRFFLGGGEKIKINFFIYTIFGGRGDKKKAFN